MKRQHLAGLLIAAAMTGAEAGDAAVVDARVERASDGSYTFTVTLRHADEGWNHYADAWEVLSPDGEVLGKRTLYHPHVNEQPFTRSLAGVRIPEGVEQVTIRAHDSVHGYGGETRVIEIPR